jgi:hypothetical protein
MSISAIKFTSGGRASLEHADDALAMEASTSEQQRLGLIACRQVMTGILECLWQRVNLRMLSSVTLYGTTSMAG